MKTLVLGLGNLLLADEGVGVHIAQLLATQIKDENICIVDVGTAVLDVLPQLEQADRIILIDTCNGFSKPGTIYSFSLDDSMDKPFLSSLHGFNLKHVLALSGRNSVPEVTVIGIEPAEISWSLELTKDVAAAVPKVIEIIKKLIQQEIYVSEIKV